MTIAKQIAAKFNNNPRLFVAPIGRRRAVNINEVCSIQCVQKNTLDDGVRYVFSDHSRLCVDDDYQEWWVEI